MLRPVSFAFAAAVAARGGLIEPRANVARRDRPAASSREQHAEHEPSGEQHRSPLRLRSRRPWARSPIQRRRRPSAVTKATAPRRSASTLAEAEAFSAFSDWASGTGVTRLRRPAAKGPLPQALASSRHCGI